MSTVDSHLDQLAPRARRSPERSDVEQGWIDCEAARVADPVDRFPRWTAGRRRRAVSRQYRWQLQRVARGLCGQCGRRPLAHYPRLCDPCALEHRRRKQTRGGSKPWHPGGRGRPPIVVQLERPHADAAPRAHGRTASRAPP
jgi:hypothetical protein